MSERVIYISGAITGTNDYLDRFAEAEEKVGARFPDNKIINPASVCNMLPELTHKQYMDICMVLLDMCDTIYMIDGWEKSHGASIEYGYALARDMIILEGDIWQKD